MKGKEKPQLFTERADEVASDLDDQSQTAAATVAGAIRSVIDGFSELSDGELELLLLAELKEIALAAAFAIRKLKRAKR